MNPLRVLAIVLGFAAGGCGEAPAPPEPLARNVLLLTVDTLRADALECYGGPAGSGRALCSLAEEGLRFHWAFSAAPYTAPSVASILTSQYPFEHGVRQSAGTLLRAEADTLAEAFRSAGYATAAFVSNPVLSLPNMDQGFDTYDLEMSRRERNRDLGEREAEATTDAALAWLAQAGERPWFLWVHYQDPHGPYETPHPSAVADAPGELELNVLDNESGYGGIPAYQALPGLFTRRAYRERYDEEVRYLDEHVARLLEALPADTGIVLTADHGEAFGEDGYFFAHGHGIGLDQVRVPMIVRAPGATAAVRQTPVSGIDVAPTALALAGIEAPEGFRGRSLLAEDLAGPVFAESRHQLATIEAERYVAAPRGGRGQARLPRSADLTPGADPPRYRPLREPPAGHAKLYEDFEARAAEAPPPPQRDNVSEETRERLRALGYVE